MVKFLVDKKEVKAEKGATLLHVCLDNDIYIPNLCYLEGMGDPPASCRLCFVEIEGENGPVTACTVKVRDGLKVTTDTPSVRRLQRSALQLLLSAHDVECAGCPANKKCGLQTIAGFLKIGLKPKRLEQVLKETEGVEDHPFLKYYPNRCVLCGRCVRACSRKHDQPFLTFAKRGFDTIVTFYGEKDLSSPLCREPIECGRVCPVGAIIPKIDQDTV